MTDHWKNCPTICANCGFCRELTDRAVKVYAGGGTENEELVLWSEMVGKTKVSA
jgi:hypothetical protein